MPAPDKRRASDGLRPVGSSGRRVERRPKGLLNRRRRAPRGAARGRSVRTTEGPLQGGLLYAALGVYKELWSLVLQSF